MKQVLALLLVLGLAACGVRPSVPIGGDPAPTEENTRGPFVYLLNGSTLTRVTRFPTPTDTMQLLAEGLTNADLAEGLTTEVPPSAAPITAVPSATGITVRISSALKYLSPLARSQLVCTALGPDQDMSIEVTLTDPTETLPPQLCPFVA